MTRTSFDLLTEPWLPVRTLDGHVGEVSLREVFARAHEIASLGGELPTTSTALLRLLLAVLHRSLETDQPDVDWVVEWVELWQQPTLPIDEINGHLDKHADRFDLLHPDRPFLQVAGLHTASGGVSDLLKLIADVPNGAQFFTTRAGRGTARIDWAEAARWVVHCHAYDPSGIKSGAVGDPRVKGGRGYPIGLGWVGNLGVVVVEGRTLRETLLLNLALHTRSGDPLPEHDSAVWERPPLTAAEETPGGRSPAGPADLLTWPSRRIRLHHDGHAVTGVLICNGDPLAPQDQFVEPMTGWRRSSTQEKKLKRELVYMPLEHDPERSLWRSLAALLPLQSALPADGASRLQPLTLQWLRRIRDEAGDVIDANFALRTRAIDLSYGNNNSVIDELVDDALIVHAVVLGEQGALLRQAALEAVESAEAAATAIGRLADNLEAASGGHDNGAWQEARELYYFALDAGFRAWLAGLLADTDPMTALRGWQRLARAIALDHEQRLLDASGPSAWVGRQVHGTKGARHVDAALASLWFRKALNTALPLASPGVRVPEAHGKGAA